MWTIILILFTLGINFLILSIPESKKSIRTETYLQIGFPFNQYEGKSVTIAVFDDTPGPGKGDIITMGKRGHKYMDQVKESGNMGTGGGTI